MIRSPMDARYSGVAITLHWVIALLLIVNIAIGFLPPLRGWMPSHKAIGITILFLTLARLAWRIAHRPPPLPASTPAWEKGAAHATHGAFYLLLVLLPLSGWAMVSGTDKRRPLTWFSTFDIPYLPVSKTIGGIGRDAHGLLGWLMLALVVIHIAAALRHHLILRDNILARMVPALRR